MLPLLLKSPRLEKLLIEADDAIRTKFVDDIDGPECAAYHKV